MGHILHHDSRLNQTQKIREPRRRRCSALRCRLQLSRQLLCQRGMKSSRKPATGYSGRNWCSGANYKHRRQGVILLHDKRLNQTQKIREQRRSWCSALKCRHRLSGQPLCPHDMKSSQKPMSVSCGKSSYSALNCMHRQSSEIFRHGTKLSRKPASELQ